MNMNGETYQICRLTAEMKRALREERGLIYEPIDYENRIEFHFLTQETLTGQETEIAYDPASWFEKCKKQGLADVKMLMPIKVEDRQLLGFANTNRASIVTFLGNGEVHYWTARWEFDSKLRAWNITYTEADWKDAPKGRPTFADNTKEFIEVLNNIEKLAIAIDEKYFAEVFNAAATILQKKSIIPEKKWGFRKNKNTLALPPIPEKSKPLWEAAAKADVFGAMGSWNDSPPYAAHQKGMETEYNTLSDELLAQIRLAILYAVNEW